MNWNIFWNISFVVFCIGVIFATGILYNKFTTLEKVCQLCGISIITQAQSGFKATLDGMDTRLKHIELEQTAFWNAITDSASHRLRQHEHPRRDFLCDKLVKDNCTTTELEELATLLKNVIVEDRELGVEAVLLHAVTEARLVRESFGKPAAPVSHEC